VLPPKAAAEGVGRRGSVGGQGFRKKKKIPKTFLTQFLSFLFLSLKVLFES